MWSTPLNETEQSGIKAVLDREVSVYSRTLLRFSRENLTSRKKENTFIRYVQLNLGTTKSSGPRNRFVISGDGEA